MKPNPSDCWGTPPEIIEIARHSMGGIDLDPCSSPAFNRIVQANRYYTIEQDGLSLPWAGRVWLNPPYSNVAPWADKIIRTVEDGDVSAACVLTYAKTETIWWQSLYDAAASVWLPRGRLKHIDAATGMPRRGSNSTSGRFGSSLFILVNDKMEFFRSSPAYWQQLRDRLDTEPGILL
jgi:phage N-6-adenine-methyltransferase